MSLTTNKNGNPIVVTGTASTDETIATGQIYVRWVYWYQPSTAGHLLNLIDAQGAVVLVAYCEKANQSQWLPVYKTCDGIHCDNMDSGSLYIYIR